MAADEALNALKLTDSENTPKGTDAIGTSADDELRSIKANIARSARWETTATVSAAATLTRTGLHKLIPLDGTTSAFSYTLPDATDGSMTGFAVAMYKSDSGANAITIEGSGSQTINGALNVALAKQYDSVVLVSDAANWTIASSNRNTLGAITVEGTASFSATAIFKSAVDISATASIGVLVVAGTTTAVGAVVMKSTLAAEGNVTVTGDADFQGAFNAGTATFSATAVFKSKISVSATASVGALTVAGAAYSASLVIQQDSKRTRYTQIIPGVTVPGDDTPPTTSETNPIKFGAVDPDTPTSSASATLMAVTITPSAGNLVSIDGLASFVTSNTSATPVCLFRDSDTDSIAVSNHNPPGVGFQCSVPIHYEFTATAAVSMSFHLRMGNSSGAAVGVNGDTSGNGVLGGTQGVWLRVQEIAL